jgi:Uncharacterised protein family (UPF0182)
LTIAFAERENSSGFNFNRGELAHASLFKDAATMPPVCAITCATSSCCSSFRRTCTACITVATEVGMGEGGEQTAQPMQPNFVLMKLPGETGVEFVEILPFTPANRNNLIGWIAGRSNNVLAVVSGRGCSVGGCVATTVVYFPSISASQTVVFSSSIFWSVPCNYPTRSQLCFLPSSR